MPVYLTWLASRIEDLGGTVTRLNLSALPVGPDVVVNALGYRCPAARRGPLGGPVRGQVVYVVAGRPRAVVARLLGRPHLRRTRGRTTSLSAARTRRATGAGPRRRRPRTRSSSAGGGSFRRWPSARVLEHRVGLRPARPSVRVERDGDVVHCYGHGGAGVTLSWGTADGWPHWSRSGSRQARRRSGSHAR